MKLAYSNRCSPLSGPSSNFHKNLNKRSAVAPFRCLAAMPPEGSTRAGILPVVKPLRRVTLVLA
ncbi:hypothetical protein T265_09625 [Opisthorchis viverrini]|uniref:Uncharacterized protein n=1 Tax=Opisthorchis viverrini TaxID=6198 RepID=A0A074Z588_OPIVI|nr:hypothetical protein T265_09625 [Opisthorchis viverrini]KER22233.1 hypothetical protein T265_09625 [Opisthorchis viverrini]